MNNLSLARIMYGTNDDHVGSRTMRKPGLSTVAIPMPANPVELPTLPEFLRRAWQSFRRKPETRG